METLADEEEEHLTKDEVKENIEKFESKGKHSYDFITKAGEGLKNTVTKISQHIWETEENVEIPDCWQKWSQTTRALVCGQISYVPVQRSWHSSASPFHTHHQIL